MDFTGITAKFKFVQLASHVLAVLLQCFTRLNFNFKEWNLRYAEAVFKPCFVTFIFKGALQNFLIYF